MDADVIIIIIGTFMTLFFLFKKTVQWCLDYSIFSFDPYGEFPTVEHMDGDSQRWEYDKPLCRISKE